MKIKSNLNFNTSLLARHAPSVQKGRVVIGGNAIESITIPAGSSLQLDDKEWAKFADAAKPLLDNGKLEMVIPPKKTVEEIAKEEAAEIEAAKKVLEKAEAKKAKKAEEAEAKKAAK